jgi:FKBP-type peptidyl-prolyl cis-trans isomerase FkpA
MKYILIILALGLVVNAKAQTGVQRTPGGVSYQIFTPNTGEKIKVNDVITFDFIQETDKDSILVSSYATGNLGKVQVKAPESVTDYIEINLMRVFAQLTLKDSVRVMVPADSIFKGNDKMRPPYLPKGSNLVFVLKMEKIQSLSDAIAERNAEMAKAKEADAKVIAAEAGDRDKYIASHKLVLKTTATGLKYVITKASLKPKPQKGDTVLVNYTGRSLDDKVFDSSIQSVATAAGLNEPGRTFEPYPVVIGEHRVIAGWEEGLLLLNEGSKATFVIPSNLGYGAQGSGAIMPYSTMVFDIELVKVKPIKHPVVKPVAKKPLHKKTTAKKKS